MGRGVPVRRRALRRAGRHFGQAEDLEVVSIHVRRRRENPRIALPSQEGIPDAGIRGQEIEPVSPAGVEPVKDGFLSRLISRSSSGRRQWDGRSTRIRYWEAGSRVASFGLFFC